MAAFLAAYACRASNDMATFARSMQRTLRPADRNSNDGCRSRALRAVCLGRRRIAAGYPLEWAECSSMANECPVFLSDVSELVPVAEKECLC
jgi:hypothetical protein